MDTLIAQVIADIALVLAVSSLLGVAARRTGQPRVLGQILTGLLLGPSVLGRLPGHLTSRLFPSSVLPILTVLSQIAIVIFMFVVGYELNWRMLSGRRRAGPLVAASGLLVPLALGLGAALVFGPDFARMGQSRIGPSFVLFFAVAMSITALPVLAAIIRERGIAGTTAAVTATAAAGIMDVVAWLMLAAALAAAGHGAGRPWPLTLVLISGFAALMLFGVRPVLRWCLGRRRSVLSNPVLVAFVLALGSASVTTVLGLHPVFGGLLAGLTMPAADGVPDAEVLSPMEQVAALLLPLFFVVTGLSLNIGALRPTAFVLLPAICFIASAGKLGPVYAASRCGGLGRREAATVAVLLNTRGLTELIVLNAGLSAGIIDPALFTLLVLMALITTAMTTPLLSRIRTPATLRLETERPSETAGN